MEFKFSENFDYIFEKLPDGSIRGRPWKSLTEEEKQFVYEQIAREKF